MMRLRWLLLVIPLCACARVVAGPSPVASDGDAKSLILQLFDRYDLVGLPELHRSQEVHTFLRQLVSDPRFASKVDAVVVEFGNAAYQDVADRYLRGETVAPEEVRKIWRNTGMFLVWDSPLYEQFFATVHALNSRPGARKIRIVLGDPAIAWDEVHSKEDYERFGAGDRDLFFASTVEREVLARGHKALLVIGGVHLLYAGPTDEGLPDRRRTAADLLRRRHPGTLFSFWSVSEPIGGFADRFPAAVVVTGTELGKESFARVAPKGLMVMKVVNGEKRWVAMPDADWGRIEDRADGLVGYGTTSTEVLPPPEVYRDAAYVAELRRRVPILNAVYGMDFGADLDEALAKAGVR